MEQKRLYRSRKDKIIAGVCGGMGEYFELDPTIIRIIFVILLIWGGIGILLYIVAVILIPENPSQVETRNKKGIEKEVSQRIEAAAQDIKKSFQGERKGLKGEQIFGLLVLLLGVVFLARNFFPWFGIELYWPIILIVIGIALFISGSRKGKK